MVGWGRVFVTMNLVSLRAHSLKARGNLRNRGEVMADKLTFPNESSPAHAVPDSHFFNPSPSFGATTLSPDGWETAGEDLRNGFHQPGELRDWPPPSELTRRNGGGAK